MAAPAEIPTVSTKLRRVIPSLAMIESPMSLVSSRSADRSQRGFRIRLIRLILTPAGLDRQRVTDAPESLDSRPLAAPTAFCLYALSVTGAVPVRIEGAVESYSSSGDPQALRTSAGVLTVGCARITVVEQGQHIGASGLFPNVRVMRGVP